MIDAASALDRLLRETTGREIPVFVSERTEERLRGFLVRVNRSMVCSPFFEPADLFGDSDEDLSYALLACMERGLDADERERPTVRLNPKLEEAAFALIDSAIPPRRGWRRRIGRRR